MSNRVFEKGRQGFADGSIDWDTQNIKAVLVDLHDADTMVKAITGATNATPIAVECTGHSFANGDIVVIGGVTGNTAANGTWKVSNQSTNNFDLVTLDGLNSTGNGAFSASGWVINLTGADNLDDINAGVVATSGNMGTKTVADGVIGCADFSLTTVSGDQCEALVWYYDSGSPATSRLIFFNDGKTRVAVASDALISATTLWIEPLERNLAAGTTIVLSNGVTATLSAPATAGARSLAVNAMSAAVAAGHSGDAAYTGSGLPITPNGNDISVAINTGVNKLFKL